VSALAFQAFTRGDRPMLAAWLAEPHVRRWYGRTGLLDHVDGFIDADWIDPLVMLSDGRPVGYLQAYRPHDYAAEPHPYRDLPKGAVGIDMLIGDPAMAGRGLGPRFCEAFAQTALVRGRPCLFADPHPDNRIGVRAYGKAGFVPACERDTPWGRVLLMIRPIDAQLGPFGPEDP
jgi:aminoglycoside 6'-N-acetyltransferase